MNPISAPRCLTKKSGFTLVELLVVIGIIAILAGVLLAAGTAAINASKRLKAANYMQQIQTGVLNYYTEYSVYPTPTGLTAGQDFKIDDTNTATGGGTWPTLMQCLCGMISPSTGMASTQTTFPNTRSVAFLQGIKTADVASSGSAQDAPLNALPPDNAHLYFNIAVDTGYVGILGAGDTTGGSAAWLPKFNPPTTSGFTGTGGGGTTTSGVALWCNCNAKGYSNSGYWRSTY